MTLKQLRKILRSFGVSEDPARGKGSHTLFSMEIDGRVFSYPVPTSRRDVLPCYIKGCREKFRLDAENGVSDKEFYGRG